jgi:ribosome-interacting GTPase 1
MRVRVVCDNGPMPTNVTPEFKKLQAEYRRTRDPHERLALLREMMRSVPKHKGTEHLRADLKTTIKELTEELSAPGKAGARTGPQVAFRPQGAAQLAIAGPPNGGKSALHDRLTGSHSSSEPFPYATQWPQPGMFSHGGIAFQLIDVPSIGAEHAVPYLADTLRQADGCLFVVDLGQPGVVERAEAALSILEERHVHLNADWPRGRSGGDEDDLDVRLPTLLVANKTDLIDDPVEELAVLEELLAVDFPSITVSAATGYGLDRLGPWLFEHLGVVRAYTRIPGRPPDLDHPFALRRGDTVAELAELIHKDIAAGLKYARIWGEAHFDGQQVGRDQVLSDGDVVELHS